MERYRYVLIPATQEQLYCSRQKGKYFVIVTGIKSATLDFVAIVNLIVNASYVNLSYIKTLI